MKTAIISVLSFAAGATASYFFVKNKMEKVYDEERQDLLDELYELRGIRDAVKAKTEESDIDTVESKEEETVVYKKPEKKKKSSKKKNDDAIDYNKISAKNDSEEPEMPMEIYSVKPEGKDRYCITPDEYIDRNGYEKVTYTYFEGDKTFVDEDDQVVDNGMLYIGEENLDNIGNYEDGVMYVRNDYEGTDYEIIFEDASYGDYAVAHGLNL